MGKLIKYNCVSGFEKFYYFMESNHLCCGKHPRAGTDWIGCESYIYFYCEDCGRRTEHYDMTWQAQRAWDSLVFNDYQLCFF